MGNNAALTEQAFDLHDKLLRRATLAQSLPFYPQARRDRLARLATKASRRTDRRARRFGWPEEQNK